MSPLFLMRSSLLQQNWPRLSVVIIVALIASTVFPGPPTWSEERGPGMQNHALASTTKPPETKFAYFFGTAGEFLKIELDSLQIDAHWMLPRITGLAELMPAYLPRGSHSALGYWLPHNVRYDTVHRLLYGVFPKTAEDLEDNYRVVALQLSLMEVDATLDLPSQPGGPPAVLLTPDRSKLLVNLSNTIAEDAGHSRIVSTIDIYEARTLRKLKTMQETVDEKDYLTAKVPLNTAFSDSAYFAADGNTIYDQREKIMINYDQGMIKEKIDLLQPLTEAQRLRLKPFEEVSPVTGKPWIPSMGIVDSKAGRALISVTNAQRAKRFLWILDLDAQKVFSPLIEVSPVPARLYLSPNGRPIILEVVERRKVHESGKDYERDYKTGKFTIYDVVSGKLVATFERRELAGFRAHLLGIAGI